MSEKIHHDQKQLPPQCGQNQNNFDNEYDDSSWTMVNKSDSNMGEDFSTNNKTTKSVKEEEEEKKSTIDLKISGQDGEVVSAVIVRTREELEEAKSKQTREIIVEGELAHQVRNGKSIKTLGYVSFGILATALVAAPFTAGTSLTVAATTISASTGISVALITASIGCGLSLLFAIWKDYDEVDFEVNANGTIRLRLRRRTKTNENTDENINEDDNDKNDDQTNLLEQEDKEKEDSNPKQP